MPCVGKTTLANKVFKSEGIQFHFRVRVWIYVSQSYKKRDVYLQILKKLRQDHDYDMSVSNEELASKIKEVLKAVKYLIVLDDVWSENAFTDINDVFPQNKGSRVIVTTPREEVARIANSLGEPHSLKFDDKESWELLEKKVFGEEVCPDDLKEYGEKIAKKCDALPLAVLLIAGILSGKLKTRLEWRKVANNFSGINRMDIKSYEKLFQLSYDDLPDDLKSCFLYFGAFSNNGNDIHVAKLIQLWIAEGFIEEEGKFTMEEIAYEKLCTLVSRNLVMATQQKRDGQIKTCRVHDMLLQFCKNEERRCLSVDDCPFEEFISSRKKPENVRSLLCFASSGDDDVPPAKIQALRKNFPLLRVLHFANEEYVCFKHYLWRLFHLRYISIGIAAIKFLPKEIGNLQNLQTFIFWTRESSLEVRADIWSMSSLRHFQTNRSAKLPPPSSVFPNQNLQTISKVSPSSCTAAALAKAPNLKKLVIQGILAQLFETDKINGTSLFQNLTQLKFLKTLKLLNDDGEEIIQRLPHKYEFPANLTKLTLSSTNLPWSELSVLGTLESLEILKLIDRAVVGKYWEPSIGGFLCLRVLQIEMTDLRFWKVSNKNFPMLKKSLVLSLCSELEEIPIELAYISSLQEINLNHTDKAIMSAQQILMMKKDPTKKCTSSRFKLTIFPPP